MSRKLLYFIHIVVAMIGVSVSVILPFPHNAIMGGVTGFYFGLAICLFVNEL